MKEYEIDLLAQSCLTQTRCIFGVNDGVENSVMLDDLRQRVLKTSFDCTPNWGIRGVKPSTSRENKQNWYLKDPSITKIAEERYSNLDLVRLNKILTGMVCDVVGPEFQVKGFGVYGSYIYRNWGACPSDLDVLVITEGDEKVELDALRYRTRDLRKIFINPDRSNVDTDELGLSIVSVDAFNPRNVSYIATDCALLDVSTTISYQSQVDAGPLPAFVIVQNAMKIVRWGISTLFDKPQTLLSRVDEAIRMRQLLGEENKNLALCDLPNSELLPKNPGALLKNGYRELLERSHTLLNIFENDERQIREKIAASILFINSNK